MSTSPYRPGTVVAPITRLDPLQLEMLDQASLAILSDPGILCFNEHATAIFAEAGCPTTRASDEAWTVKLTEKVVRQALASAPSQVVLGARLPENRLVLDASTPRVYFGTGSETNIYLEGEMQDFVSTANGGRRVRHPVYRGERGSLKRLCDSARLCDALDHVDFFIRNVNVQDEDITPDNKDVNVFFAALLYMSKHVMAGLTEIDALDNVVRIGEQVAGSPEAFRECPPLSFIACLVKSPLQMVEDTTDKVIAIARRGVPLVISSSPQGGSTAPVQEEGMVALINAEILAGITLTQLVNPGTPVLYGAVPVRARLDTLHDLYGAPEFIHYGMGCAQMARHYGVPCYSSAGVGDASVPGMGATVEKLLAHLGVAQAGAQYIHYAFGLLDRTNIFCPVQAVLDDANIGVVKEIIRQPQVTPETIDGAVKEVRKVMASPTRLFARHIRKHLRRGVVSAPHPLEAETDADGLGMLENAFARLATIRGQPGYPLPDEIANALFAADIGLLPRERFEL